ncbi:UNVERIFIED_CONTAM: hypothetical protein PYX00_002037 [Menopon gallinae]|uniref:Uncharacterized protein n=1 Tax=Menopon gallinae TaxID=328185 RepID=A0AAW2IGD0_9NEOP
MESALFFLFALLSCTYAQYMSTWGSSTGYSNAMHMPMPYSHGMPYHHGIYREAGMDAVPYKADGVMVYRAKVPSRLGLQDYSLLNVNGPENDDLTEHVIYRQSGGDMKRPIVGVLSLLSSPLPLAMGSMGSWVPWVQWVPWALWAPWVR